MDLSIITEYISPIAMVAALGVGYIFKNVVTTDKVNRFIPLIAAVVGIAVCTATDISTGMFGVNTIVVGMISGLASTGLYEAFKNLIGDLSKAEVTD